MVVGDCGSSEGEEKLDEERLQVLLVAPDRRRVDLVPRIVARAHVIDEPTN